MEHLPAYIKVTFELSTVFTILMLYIASKKSTPVIIIFLIWLALQALISLSGFYIVETGTPPRFALLLFPPVILIVVLFLITSGKRFINNFDVKLLVLLQIVRIPVELTLFWLFQHKAVPQIMTFEGRNFDILCGLSAPVIYYFGYVKRTINSKLILAWHVACLLLLANIVITAVLSAPFAFQKTAFNQPNIALFYFPFVWLPCCIVPVVLFAHLVCIKRLDNDIQR